MGRRLEVAETVTRELCLDGPDLAEAVRDLVEKRHPHIPTGTDLLVRFGFTKDREPSQFTCLVTWEEPT